MIFYIPISEQELSNSQVVKALETVPKYELVISKEYNEPDHYSAIIKNRIKCINLAHDAGKKYVAMSDSRTVHLRPDNYEVMEKFLEQNQIYGGVSLFHGTYCRGSFGKHINLACCMFRTELVHGFNFNVAGLEKGCECKRIAKYLRDRGYKFEYLEKQGGRIIKYGKL